MTVLKIIIAFAFFFVLLLSWFAGINYPGSIGLYLLFTFLANALLLNGFRRRALFFDTFIAGFFWLGFWLKFSIPVAMNQFEYNSLSFDGSPEAFDRALIVSSVGLASLLLASLVRMRFFTYPDEASNCEASGLFRFYKRNRIFCVSIFLVFVILITGSNVWLGIYQRGMAAQTVLPFGLNGFYKWMLQFGLASIATFIIRYEIEINRNLTILAIVPSLLEGCLSNISLLSRGMILNSASLALGSFRLIALMRLKVSFLRILTVSLVFLTLFASTVLAVNYLRASAYQNAVYQRALGQEARVKKIAQLRPTPSADTVQSMTIPLFLDRWVGIDGVVGVSSSDALGWSLWQDAWSERFKEGVLSIYDDRFIDTPYRWSADQPRFHFVTLPGIVAFLYFPGSLWFLFFSLLLCAWIASLIEVITFRYGGQNLIFCSLIGQVIAYRYANFGYVPVQTYMIFAAVLLNILAVFFVSKFLKNYR